MQIFIENLQMTKTLNVDGDIYIKLGDVCFPEAGWFDIVSSVLDIWLQEVSSFCCKQRNFCELSFMDGPFCVQIRRKSGKVVAGLYEDGEPVQPEQVIDYKYFLFELVRVSETLICFIQSNCSEWYNLHCVASIRYSLNIIKERVCSDCDSF